MKRKIFRKGLGFLQSLFNKNTSLLRFSKGFTLVELLVVLGMISVLITLLIIFINPVKQVQKAKDANRQQDLLQVNNALDNYYNDNNCYPQSVPFGSNWQVNSMVYMQKVPQDPDCDKSGICYRYITDSSSTCPQWYVVFTKVYNAATPLVSCSLERLQSCVPSNYSSAGYNYCIVSGIPNCAFLSTQTLPAITSPGGNNNPGPTNTPTPTIPVVPTPTVTPTPTITPTPTPSCSKDYSCTGSPLRCNIIAPLGSGQYCFSSPRCGGNCP